MVLAGGTFLVLTTAVAQNQVSLNAGFVSGVWYSKRPIFVGDKVRIYAALQNRSGFDLKGKVKFFDYDDLIGEADFAALSGRLIEVWVDWEAPAGEHNVYTVIDGVQKSEPGKKWLSTVLAFSSSGRDNFFVDADTDKDGLGNLGDEDDDNDGLSDKDDIEPLVFNKTPEPENEPTPPAPEKAAETVYKQAKKVVELIIKKEKTFSPPEPVKIVFEAAKAATVETVVKINVFADEQKAKIEARKIELKQELGLAKATADGGGGPANTGLTGFLEQIFSAFGRKGDANNDGQINLLDFNLLMVNWGMTNDGNIADFNSDRRVDISDFNLLMVGWD